MALDQGPQSTLPAGPSRNAVQPSMGYPGGDSGTDQRQMPGVGLTAAAVPDVAESYTEWYTRNIISTHPAGTLPSPRHLIFLSVGYYQLLRELVFLVRGFFIIVILWCLSRGLMVSFNC